MRLSYVTLRYYSTSLSMTTAPLADKFLQVGVVVVRRYPVGVGIAQDGADLELLLADFVEVLLRHWRVDMLGEPERPVADRLRRDEALAMVAMVAGKSYAMTSSVPFLAMSIARFQVR